MGKTGRYFSMSEWNEISGKCFSHASLGPGYTCRSCDLETAVVFVATAISHLPTHPPTLDSVLYPV